MALDFAFQSRRSDSGDIAVSVRRSNLRCAPEGVHYMFRATGALGGMPKGFYDFFDGGVYDPQKHRVFYFARFGDTDKPFRYVEHVPHQWNNQNEAEGHTVCHNYDEPGTFTGEVIGWNPSLGLFKSKMLEPVTVGSTDAAFPGTQTKFVSRTLDDTNAPPGAQVLATIGEAREAARNDTSPVRIMFDEGETYNPGQMTYGSDFPSLHICGYRDGSGARAFLQMPEGTPGDAVTEHLLSNDYHGLNPNRDFTVYGFDASSTWTSTDETGYEDSIFLKCFANPSHYTHVTDVKVTNCRNFYLASGNVGFSGTTLLMIDNYGFDFRDMAVGDYSVNDNEADIKRVGYAGNCLLHHPFAVVDGSKDAADPSVIHGIHRDADGHYTCIIKCDYNPRSGWSTLGLGFDAGQPCVRTNTGEGPNRVCCMTQNAFEGGNNVIEGGPATEGDTTRSQNNLIMHNLLIGDYQTRYFITIGAGGWTICGNLAFHPNAKSVTSGGDFTKFVETVKFNGITPEARRTPTAYFGNTVISELTAANAVGNGQITGFGLVIGSGESFNVTCHDNIYHQSGVGLTPDTPMIRIDLVASDGVSPIIPRGNGYIFNDGSIEPGTASPKEPVYILVPDIGSPAYQSAVGPLFMPRDFFGNDLIAPRNKGAVG